MELNVKFKSLRWGPSCGAWTWRNPGVPEPGSVAGWSGAPNADFSLSNPFEKTQNDVKTT